MAVGYCEVTLHLFGVDSLKGKRRVLKSVVERLKNKFNISIAEVDKHDLWQASVVGFAVVGNDHAFIGQVMDAALRQMEGVDDVEIVAVEREVY
ncbi:DUF503 domain-containing protein [Heliophilum fasciatum]|uniref:DUF503 domain-containing protein n=1 Tax=Heliophilum fasciatum TaxID=35700 RepID=A0A4R2RYJ4_9FIRM|nr:DUF503 domain-containing protein [Heliophilum fasciatum]MCW2276922.1 uncharacterized protein YlxP (DUF503 family) [Heliophilum fasciatum]TCP68618.1 hypothetical protein EDD73_10213 [Heliophilum fasciatum]